MDLYFLKGYLDIAATTLADLNALAAALDNPASAANQATIARVSGKIPPLVQADDGEPLNIYAYDAAGTASAWATDGSTSLSVGLGAPSPDNSDTYASTSSFSISGGGRVGTLALNTRALSNALGMSRSGRAIGAVLQVRKTTGGVTKTIGLLPVQVQAGVLSTSLTEYIGTANLPPGSVAPLTQITSLTGGGSTALDGIATAGGAVVTGTTVLLSYGRVGQHWQLVAGSDAEAVASGVVRPDDYDGSTNARVWVQL